MSTTPRPGFTRESTPIPTPTGYESPDDTYQFPPTPLSTTPAPSTHRPPRPPLPRSTKSTRTRLSRIRSRPEPEPGAVSQDAGGYFTAPPQQSQPGSLDGAVRRARGMLGGNGRVGLRDRIGCFKWTWFTMTMATGGIANVLHSIPYRSQWLTGVGLAFFFLNLCLFVMNCVLISLRFYWHPGAFVDSFTDQFESLFISAIIVSIATILITVSQYGIPNTGPWLLSVVEALFWVYVGVSTLISAGLYLTLWSTQVFPIHTMTPVWVFPAYPLLLTAPLGANLVSAAASTDRLATINALPIATAAVTAQGTGFLISFMICAAFLYRLMTQKLPRDHQRPGVFISIGPSGFTAAGIIQLGTLAPSILPPTSTSSTFTTVEPAPVLRLLAYLTGLWLWGLSAWFFLVSVGSLTKYMRPTQRAKLRFQMTWFSFVFPNTALVTATEALGLAFDSDGLQVVGCVLAAGLVVVWVLVFTQMLRCLWRRELLWPKDQD